MSEVRLRHLEEEMKTLKTEFLRLEEVLDVEPIKLRLMPDKDAEKLIRESIKQQRNMDNFEIAEKLQLPIEQVDFILNKLLKEGFVNERITDTR